MLPQNIITLLAIASTVTAFPYPTLRPDLDTVASACGPVIIPTPAPTAALPISGLPSPNLPVSSLPVSGLPVPSLPVSGLPAPNLPVSSLPVSGLPVSSLPVSGLPVTGLPVTGLPVTGLPTSTLTVSNLPISTTGVLPVPTLLHPNLPTSVLPSALPTLLGSSGSNGNSNSNQNGNQNGNQNVGNYGQNAGGAASNSGAIKGDYTVEQATTTCGNAQLNCCNRVIKSGDTTDAGVVGAVLGSGDLGIQCTPLDIAIIGVQVPINTVCAAKAACCQGDTVQNGLVNIGCIALASLL